jgi:UDP-glucose:(heptosyl)LPS alpha-1,3-glucosyltransferase
MNEAGIETVLIADSRWPEEAWPGGTIERTSSGDPVRFASEVMAIKARYPDARLFSMDRVPGADVFRAGDGLHSAWLARLAEEEGGGLGDWFRRHRKMHRQLLKLEKQLFQDPQLRVVANSRMVADELIARHSFPEDRIAVVPNGFDPVIPDDVETRERRQRLRAHLGIPDNAVVFLFVGSGWKRKGAQILVDAFRELNHPDAWLLLVGKGTATGMTHPRIHHAGAVANPLDWFLSSDLLVLPTLYDPFSNACLEAAAYGLPVLTSDANGFREVIAAYPDAGEVLPGPRRPEAWCKAMRRWMNSELRARAKPQLLAIREHFTVARNVAATIDFLNTTFAPK